MNKPCLLLLTAMSVPAAGYADVFRSINENGVPEFSDRAASVTAKKITISKPVVIQPLSEIPTLRTRKNAQDNTPSEILPADGLYKDIRILEPQDNSSSWLDTDVPVKIALDPGLAIGHEVAVLLDGIEIAVGQDFNYLIPEIDRGQHTLQAQVRDTASGETLSSESIIFQVHRRSDQSNSEMLHPSLQTETVENPSDINVILSY